MSSDGECFLKVGRSDAIAARVPAEVKSGRRLLRLAS